MRPWCQCRSKWAKYYGGGPKAAPTSLPDSLSGADKGLGSAGFPNMTPRAWLKWMIWASCLVGVLLGNRPAEAAAPMCDGRGASAIAPPPILPVRDVKLQAAPRACERLV